MQKVSIEYSHIYTNQSFGFDQVKSIEILHREERMHKKNGYSTSRVIMIDDYSPGIDIERFDYETLFNELKKSGATPNVIIKESSLIYYCKKLLNEINDKKVKKSLLNYITKRGKFPCSLFIATWYLIRLGVYDGCKITPLFGVLEESGSDKVLTIIPKIYDGAEAEADKIILATKYKKYINKINRIIFDSTSEFSDWKEFDTLEYLNRNYMKRILPEDQEIIKTTVETLAQINHNHTYKNILDIGCGPNLYPALLIKPFTASDATIHMVDYAEQNLKYMKQLISNKNLQDTWKQFENLMVSIKGSTYRESIEKVTSIMQVEWGDIFNLEKERFDAGLSFFVTESISSDFGVFQKATHSFLDSIKSKGIVIAAHMLGSHSYFAGEGTKFPSTKINKKQLLETYEPLLDIVHISTFGHDSGGAVRTGYSGMALLIGFKR